MNTSNVFGLNVNRITQAGLAGVSNSSSVNSSALNSVYIAYYSNNGPTVSDYTPSVGDYITFRSNWSPPAIQFPKEALPSGIFQVKGVGVDEFDRKYFTFNGKSTPSFYSGIPKLCTAFLVKLATDSALTLPSIELIEDVGVNTRSAVITVNPVVKIVEDFTRDVTNFSETELDFVKSNLKQLTSEITISVKSRASDTLVEQDWAIVPSRSVLEYRWGDLYKLKHTGNTATTSVSSPYRTSLWSAEAESSFSRGDRVYSVTPPSNYSVLPSKDYKYRFAQYFADTDEEFIGTSDWITPAVVTIADLAAVTLLSASLTADNMISLIWTKANVYSDFVNMSFQLSDDSGATWVEIAGDATQESGFNNVAVGGATGTKISIFNTDGTRRFAIGTAYILRSVMTVSSRHALSGDTVTTAASPDFTIAALAAPTLSSVALISDLISGRVFEAKFRPLPDQIDKNVSGYKLQSSVDSGSTWVDEATISGVELLNGIIDERQSLDVMVLNKPTLYKYPLSVLNNMRPVGRHTASFVLKFTKTDGATAYQFRVQATDATNGVYGVPTGVSAQTSNSNVITLDMEIAETYEENTVRPPTGVTASFTGTGNYQVNLAWVNAQITHGSNIIFYREVVDGVNYKEWQLLSAHSSSTATATNLNVPGGKTYQFRVDAVDIALSSNLGIEEIAATATSGHVVVPALSPPFLLDYNTSGNDLVFTWSNAQTDHQKNVFRYREQSAVAWTEVDLDADDITTTLSGAISVRTYTFIAGGLEFFDTGDTVNSVAVYRSAFTLDSPNNYFEIWNDGTDLILSYARSSAAFGWNFGAVSLANGINSTSNLGSSTLTVSVSSTSRVERSMAAYFFEVVAVSGVLKERTGLASNPLKSGIFWCSHYGHGYEQDNPDYLEAFADETGKVSFRPEFYTHIAMLSSSHPFLNGSAIPVGRYWDSVASAPRVLNSINPTQFVFGPEVTIPTYSDAGAPENLPDDLGIYPVKLRSSPSGSYTALVEVYGNTEGFMRSSFIAFLNGEERPTNESFDPLEWIWGPPITLPDFVSEI